MSACSPTESPLTSYTATPSLSALSPSSVVPSRNTTLPVGVPPPVTTRAVSFHTCSNPSTRASVLNSVIVMAEPIAVAAAWLLFSGNGSNSPPVTLAVLRICSPAAPDTTFTTRLNPAGLPVPSAAVEHTTSPAAPTAGVRQDQPAGAVSAENTVWEGSMSRSVTSVAPEGPPLLTVRV